MAYRTAQQRRFDKCIEWAAILVAITWILSGALVSWQLLDAPAPTDLSASAINDRANLTYALLSLSVAGTFALGLLMIAMLVWIRRILVRSWSQTETLIDDAMKEGEVRMAQLIKGNLSVIGPEEPDGDDRGDDGNGHNGGGHSGVGH